MYFDYLRTRIVNLKKRLEDLEEAEQNEDVLLANIDEIRNSIFDILDHSINHFSNKTTNGRDIYFPILYINQGIEDLRKDPRYLKVKELIGENACKFLESAYKINEGHNKCLNLLNASSKHRNIDKISKTKKDVSAKCHNFGGPKIEQDMYGNLNIPGIMHGAGDVRMHNCVISNQNGFTIIELLDAVRIKGNALIIKKKDQETEVLIKPFLKKCLDCTEKIINLWDEYNKQ